jgi:MFS family permease
MPAACLEHHMPSPLRMAVLRALLIATLVSNVGDWMEDVGEAWLMTSLRGTPLMVALVQSSASLPVFLFALPAGTLADIVDRRRLLMLTQTWLLFVALSLGVFTLTRHIGAWGLLGCTFAMGIGAAMAGPAWQSAIADVVPRKDLPRAMMLNEVAFNVGRVAGPAIGGTVVARAGPGATFLLNALSFVTVLVILARWTRPGYESLLPAERVWAGMRTGLRYVREAPSLLAVLVRSFSVLVFASALWATLPSFVSRCLGGSASGYGILLTSLGTGAVASAFLLSRVRDRFAADTVLIAMTLLLAAGIFGLALASTMARAALATFVCGAAWLSILSVYTAAAQKSAADWVRSRALAVFLLVTEGAMTFGSVGWGWLATRFSVRFALAVGAAGVVTSVPVALLFRLRDLEIDRAPTEIYPIPAAPSGIDLDHTPIIVEIEYRVAPANRDAFRRVLESVGRSRRRTGAAIWTLAEDSSDTSRFVELFLVDSWNEHHRQHGRWTKHDRNIWEHARSLVQPGTEPKVLHLVQASDRHALAASATTSAQ